MPTQPHKAPENGNENNDISKDDKHGYAFFKYTLLMMAASNRAKTTR